MIAAAALLAAAALGPDQRCPVIRAILADLAFLAFGDRSRTRADSYVDPDAPGIKSCPQELAAMPPGLAVADAPARSRAGDHGPSSRNGPAAYIYMVGLPAVSPDGSRATVSLSYTCTGLCGGEQTIQLRRTPRGWLIDSRHMNWVS